MTRPSARFIQPAFSFLVMAGMGFAAIWSFRLAWADLLLRRNTVESVQRAAEITPQDAKVYTRAADLLAQTNPASPRIDAALQRALDLNPRDTNAWIARAFRTEMSGNAVEAEKLLLEAARIDHTFKPAWTLANFYIREGQTDNFWKWIRACLELVEPKNLEPWTYDPRPLFDLCWNVTNDAGMILQKGIPPRHFVLVEYVYYLMERDRLDAALGIAPLLTALSTERDRGSVRNLCERLIQADRPADAVTVWNLMTRNAGLRLDALDPQKGASLTNGDFRAAPLSANFDWRPARPAGVLDSYSPATSSIRFDLNGDQSESCVLMVQMVPLLPGRRYRLTFRYQTPDLAGQTGLHWRIARANTAERTDSEILPGREEPAEQTFEFTAPSGSGLANLEFGYDRRAGTTRARGSVRLLHTALTLVS